MRDCEGKCEEKCERGGRSVKERMRGSMGAYVRWCWKGKGRESRENFKKK